MNNIRVILHSNARIGLKAHGVISGEGLPLDAIPPFRIFSVNIGKPLDDADLPRQNGMRFYSYPTGAVACMLKDRFDGLLHIRTYKSLEYLKTYGVNAPNFDVQCLSEDWELAEYLKFKFRLSPDEASVILASLYLYEATRSAAKFAFKSEFSV